MGGNYVADYLKQVEKDHAKGHATEHTHRPALQKLIQALYPKINAVNEPKRVACGAPDFIALRGDVPVGYIETKDVGAPLNTVEKSDQLKRYLASLNNLILTDYLEFRLYSGGELKLEARLAADSDGKLKLRVEGEKELALMLESFMAAEPPAISSPRELADKMAHTGRLIRETITAALSKESEKGTLHQQMEGFREVLLHDLTEAQFADMYAQTICYGLFTARCYHKPGERFTRKNAPHELPKTNPFLRKLFSHIAGMELDDRIAWVVDDLAELLNRAEINAILRDFGRQTRREDPVIHFYETFLAAYDPKMREARGVYYTPEPVVSYIVRSVDYLLKEEFGLKEGLADHSKVTLKGPEGEKREVHKVQILDPATGTGTFLKGVINKIYESFAKNKGAWPGYVADHLLPRLYGFELLMAPYAVAHMKLGLQLKETHYDFEKEQRLQIYLTNALEEAHGIAQQQPFTQWLAEEAREAGRIKKEAPVMVVLGNPPYSGHSANTGEWIARLLKGHDSMTGKKTDNYFEVDGEPLGERNPKWLNDDYVKFIRFAQWRIEQTGYGILAFISNHGYLNNPTFRGMRQSLMNTFDDIYILDLHGNSKKKETAPDGGKDENVFDIQQGVAIGIFVKKNAGKKKPATVHHFDQYGLREVFKGKGEEKELVDGKYHWLYGHELADTKWKKLKPSSPYYVFTPQDAKKREEFENWWSVNKVFPINNTGLITSRDSFVFDFNKANLEERIREFAMQPIEFSRNKYGLGDVRETSLQESHALVKSMAGNIEKHIHTCQFRPFDRRYLFYHHSLVRWPVYNVMSNMLEGENLALITARSNKSPTPDHFFCTDTIMETKCGERTTQSAIFPLYLYEAKKKPREKGFATALLLFEPEKEYFGKRPNLAKEFIEEFSQKLGLKFLQDGTGDLKKTFGPEDIFHYIYAIFHSSAYRKRYAEFLKIDFPRVPLTENLKLFKTLCALGDELTAVHLLKQAQQTFTEFPVKGSNEVETVRYEEPVGKKAGKVWINKTQYFEKMSPQVWEFQIGGYQVMQKWLKDRKGRRLTFDDIHHYQNVAAALAETIRLMEQVDAAIEKEGGWPIT